MKKTIQIRGMYCPNCEARIAAALGRLESVKSVKVDYASGKAELECWKAPDMAQIESVLHELGYELAQSENELVRAASYLMILFGLTIILDRTGLLNRLVPKQLGESGMSYGLFFVTGLMTSVHCIAMCGGINLSQSLPGRGKWSSLLYNAGRVVSYTVIGALLGLIGHLLGGGSFAASPLLQGSVKLLAGAFMLLAGINLLGLFPPLRRLRLSLPRLRTGSRLPFVIGLLNGLMPCGPLQAMQLAALGSGSPVNGALSMFFFSLGTVPLMLGLGGLVALLGQRFARIVNTAGAVMVAVFGIAMLSQGAALTGMIENFQLWAILLTLALVGLVSLLPVKKAVRLGATAIPVMALALVLFLHPGRAAVWPEGEVRKENGVQLINSTLVPGRYPDITVRAGLPVRWTIQADESAINGCNYTMIIPGLGKSLSFQPGDNLLEFTPETVGTIPYSCWMGMIRGSITVTE